jgi:hypothetical protein
MIDSVIAVILILGCTAVLAMLVTAVVHEYERHCRRVAEQLKRNVEGEHSE